MSKKLILLALGAVSVVMFALPAVASAGPWSIDPASNSFPQSFTVKNIGNTTLTSDGSSLKVTCSSVTGGGEYENATTGKNLTLTFHSCTESLFNTECTSTGQPSGTIKTTDLTFHNIKLEANPVVRGILITPNAGHFATFTCGGGLVKVAVNGNGIVGEVSAPACGATSKTGTLKYESVATGTQKWTQETTTGTKFDLTSSENGGAARTSSQDGEGTVTFNENQTFTC